METLMIAPPAPGNPPAPPVNVNGMPLGFDIGGQNGLRPATVADFQALKRAGKIFGIIKVSEGARDPEFLARYPMVRDGGLIRGVYDLFFPMNVNDEVNLVVNNVPRLTPGDLAPSLDLEDKIVTIG